MKNLSHVGSFLCKPMLFGEWYFMLEFWNLSFVQNVSGEKQRNTSEIIAVFRTALTGVSLFVQSSVQFLAFHPKILQIFQKVQAWLGYPPSPSRSLPLPFTQVDFLVHETSKNVKSTRNKIPTTKPLGPTWNRKIKFWILPLNHTFIVLRLISVLLILLIFLC